MPESSIPVIPAQVGIHKKAMRYGKFYVRWNGAFAVRVRLRQDDFGGACMAVVPLSGTPVRVPSLVEGLADEPIRTARCRGALPLLG